MREAAVVDGAIASRRRIVQSRTLPFFSLFRRRAFAPYSHWMLSGPG
jgi:hypothetical protein